MGLLDIAATAYVAKLAHNKMNPPFVTVPNDFEIVSMKGKGLNEYEIRYRKKGSHSTSLMIISRNQASLTGGWEFHWG